MRQSVSGSNRRNSLGLSHSPASHSGSIARQSMTSPSSFKQLRSSSALGFTSPSEKVQSPSASTSTPTSAAPPVLKVTVCVRFRPSETNAFTQTQNRVECESPPIAFEYDKVLPADTSGNASIEELCQPLVDYFAATGGNSTLLAYGQTNSGKTYTINQALPLCLRAIFDTGKISTLKVSFIEIYNEDLIDLLIPAASPQTHSSPMFANAAIVPAIREQAGQIILTNLTEVTISSTSQALELFQGASSRRQTADNGINSQSSRSHAIFILASDRGRMCFVDLAGSERLQRTASTKDRQREGISINSGLHTLSNVISALAAGRTHIPYRDSKLTRLLQDSLGGSAKTLLIACVDSGQQNKSESINTLRYAHTARGIQNKLPPKDIKKDGIQGMIRELDRLNGIIRQLREEQQIQQNQRHKNNGTVPSSPKPILSSPVNQSHQFLDLVKPIIEEYEQSISALESQIKLSSAALAHTNAVVHARDAEIDSLRVKSAKNLALAMSLQANCDSLMKKQTSLDKYVSNLESAYDERDLEASQMSVFQDEIAKYRSAELEAQKQIEDMEDTMQSTKTTNEMKAECIATLEHQLDQRSRQLEELQLNFDQIRSQLTNAQEQLNALLSQTQSLKADRDSLISKVQEQSDFILQQQQSQNNRETGSTPTPSPSESGTDASAAQLELESLAKKHKETLAELNTLSEKYRSTLLDLAQVQNLVQINQDKTEEVETLSQDSASISSTDGVSTPIRKRRPGTLSMINGKTTPILSQRSFSNKSPVASSPTVGVIAHPGFPRGSSSSPRAAVAAVGVSRALSISNSANTLVPSANGSPQSLQHSRSHSLLLSSDSARTQAPIGPTPLAFARTTPTKGPRPFSLQVSTGSPLVGHLPAPHIAHEESALVAKLTETIRQRDAEIEALEKAFVLTLPIECRIPLPPSPTISSSPSDSSPYSADFVSSPISSHPGQKDDQAQVLVEKQSHLDRLNELMRSMAQKETSHREQIQTLEAALADSKSAALEEQQAILAEVDQVKLQIPDLQEQIDRYARVNIELQQKLKSASDATKSGKTASETASEDGQASSPAPIALSEVFTSNQTSTDEHPEFLKRPQDRPDSLKSEKTEALRISEEKFAQKDLSYKSQIKRLEQELSKIQIDHSNLKDLLASEVTSHEENLLRTKQALLTAEAQISAAQGEHASKIQELSALQTALLGSDDAFRNYKLTSSKEIEILTAERDKLQKIVMDSRVEVVKNDGVIKDLQLSLDKALRPMTPDPSPSRFLSLQNSPRIQPPPTPPPSAPLPQAPMIPPMSPAPSSALPPLPNVSHTSMSSIRSSLPAGSLRPVSSGTLVTTHDGDSMVSKQLEESEMQIRTLTKQLEHCETDLQMNIDLLSNMTNTLSESERSLRKSRLAQNELVRDRDNAHASVDSLRIELDRSRRETDNMRLELEAARRRELLRAEEDRRDRARGVLEKQVDHLSKKSKFQCF